MQTFNFERGNVAGTMTMTDEKAERLRRDDGMFRMGIGKTTAFAVARAIYEHHRTADDGRDHLMSHIMFVPSRREIDIRKPLPLAGTLFDPRRYRRP